MNKRQTLIVIVFSLVVLAGVIYGIMSKNGRMPVIPGMNGGPEATSTPAAGGKEEFTKEVPVGAEPTKPSLDIPIENKPAGSTVTNYKVINVSVSSAGYDPREIVVRKGDVVELNLSASGGSFDMFSSSAGFLVSASAGKPGKIAFTPSEPGTYSFACRDLCPGGGIIEGKLIVLP